MTSLLLLFTGGLALTLGDIIMKQWLQTSDAKLYGLGLVAYLAGLNLLAQSFRFKGIAVASALLIIFNIVSLALVGYFFFAEKISRLQLVGLSLALAAVICLEGG